MLCASQLLTVAAEDASIVMGWGANSGGLLLQGNTDVQEIPVALPSSEFGGRAVVSISAGVNFVVAANEDGDVFTWGSNLRGQLGNASAPTPSYSAVRVSALGPLAGEPVIQVSASKETALALVDDGFVWSWGSNIRGVLGNGTNVVAVAGSTNVPVWVSYNPSENGKAIWVGCGDQFCGLRTDSNKVMMWGANDYGQIGRTSGSFTFITVPALVNMTNLGVGRYFTQVSFGGSHTLALTDDKRVVAWGSNADGQLGAAAGLANSFWPIYSNFNAASGDEVVHVAAGSDHSLVLTANGLIYGWGLSQYFQLGPTPAPTNQLTPFQFDTRFIWGRVTSIHAYWQSSFATSERGRFYGWGYAGFYMLGSNTTNNSYGPLKVNQSCLPSDSYTVASFGSSGLSNTLFAIMHDIPLAPFEAEPVAAGTPDPNTEPPPYFPPVTTPTPSFSGGFPIPAGNAQSLVPAAFTLLGLVAAYLVLM